MKNAEFIHFIWMALAIALEVSANIFIKYSNGFKKIIPGAIGIASILMSFSALAAAAKGIDLSVAYAIWGGVGVALTAVMCLVLFGQKPGSRGWLGIAMIVGGISLLRLA